MATYDVTVAGKTYEVDAPDENTAWKWANYTHQNEPEAPKPGMLESGLAGVATGLAGIPLGIAHAGAKLTGIEDPYIQQKRKELEEWGKEHGTESFTGKVGATAGSLLPFLFTGPVGALGKAAEYGFNAVTMGIPSAVDAYEGAKAAGAGDAEAYEKAALGLGMGTVAPGIVNKGSKTAAALLKTGEGAVGKMGLAAGEGAVFSGVGTAANKAIELANDRNLDTPWLSPEDMAASALGFGAVRGVHHAMEAPKRAATAKADADRLATIAQEKAAREALEAAAEEVAAKKQAMEMGPLPGSVLPSAVGVPGQQDLFHAAEDLSGAKPTGLTPAEQERKGYGVEARAADMEAALQGAEGTAPITPEQRKVELQGQMQRLGAAIEAGSKEMEQIQNPDKSFRATTPEESIKAAAKVKQFQTALNAMQQEHDSISIPATPDEKLARAYSAWEKAKALGDPDAVGKQAQIIVDLRAAGAKPPPAEPMTQTALPMKNFEGTSESTDLFNQRVVGPEMAAGREQSAAAAQKVAAEQARLEVIQRNQQAPAGEANAMRQQKLARDRAAALLSAQSAPAGGVPPVQGESQLRALVHRGVGTEGRTLEDVQRDFDLAKSRRDRPAMRTAWEEKQDLLDRQAKEGQEAPEGYITSQWRGDQPPDVAAHQDALIARRQGLTQLLMAKPGEREAAQGNLRSRIVTEIETARGTQTTKAERQQIAALADPVIAKLLSLKTPTMTAAREAQTALDNIRNKFTVKNVYLPPTEQMGPREARGTELLREQLAGTPNADLLALAPRKTFKPEAAPESDAPIVAKDTPWVAALKAEQQDIDARLAAHRAATAKQQAAEERALSAGDITTTKGYPADEVAAAIARNATERMDLQGRIDALQKKDHTLSEWMLDVEPDAKTKAEKADVDESLQQARADLVLLEAAQSTLLDRTRALRRQGIMPAETPGLRSPEELNTLHSRKQEIATQLSEDAAKKAAAEQAAQTAQRIAAGKEAIATKNAATEKDVAAGKQQKLQEELAALPGMSVTHEAAEKAARLIETGPAKIEHLRAKIADPEATKTTRDHDKHELKVLLRTLQLAHDVAAGKEGAMDAVEARIVDISDKIAAYQEEIDAGQPRKYRMDKIAELKRERAALRKSEKGTFNPPTKTPISGMGARREAAADRRAKLFLEQALALEQMGTTGKLPKGRISQASRNEITPGDTRTGTPESMGQVQRENALTGATDTITTKTGTRNPVTEERKVVETNRAVGKPEQAAANVIADQLGVSTPTKEKTPVAQLEELISIKQKLLAEKIDAKAVAEKRAAEQLSKNEENKNLTDEQRRGAEEEIKKRPVRIKKEIQRLETELDRLAEEVAPLRDAEVAAAEMAAFKEAEAKATPQASVEDAKAAVVESTAAPKKQPKKTKKKGLSETAEETAGAVEDAYADYDNVADDAFARSDDPFFSRGKAKDAHTADSLVEELKPHFGGKDVRSRVNVYDTVAAMLKAHPEYEGRIPADAKGFVDGTHAFLIAENIGKGEGLSVTVHEIGAHIGMRNLFEPALYKALVAATKNWAGKKDGSLESRIAQAAKERVEAVGTAKHKYDDELLAHTIEEAMKAGVAPTKLSGKGPIGQFIGRIMQAMQKVLQRYGIAPNSLTMQHLVDMAYGAAGKELNNNGPRHGGAKLFTYAGEISHGADDTSWVKAHEMLAAGEHPAQVFRDTGWFVGADGKMRYEIDDSKSKVTLPDEAHALSYTKPDDKYKTTLGAIFEHPDLYKAYPELAKYPVEFVNEPNDTKAWMSTETLGINMHNMRGGDDFHKSLLHEVQHAIQEREGFTRGASTENAYVNIGNPEHNRAIAAYYDRKGDSTLADMAREHAEIVAPLYPAFEKADAEYRAYRDSDQYKKDAEAYKKAIAEYEEKRERLVVEVEALKAEHAKAKEAEKAAWKGFTAAKTMAELDKAKEVLRPLNANLRALATKLHNVQMEQIRLHSPSPEHTFKSIDLMAAASEAGKPLWEASEKFFDNRKTSSKRFARLFMANIAYKNKYGEVEARDTSARKDLTAEQRRQERPYSSQDVNKEELLFSRKKDPLGDYSGTAIDLRKDAPEDKRSYLKRMTDGSAMAAEHAAADMHNYVVEAMRIAGGHEGEQAEYMIRDSSKNSTLMEYFFTNGAPEVMKDSKGFTAIVASDKDSVNDFFKSAQDIPVKDGQGKFDLFTHYMTALKGLRVGPDRVGHTRAELEAVIKQVDADPKLKAALEASRKQWNKFNDPLVDMVVHTGAISKAEGEKWKKHGDYIPMYREKDGKLEMQFGDGAYHSMGDIANTPFVHMFKGSDRAILPVNESVFHNVRLLLDVATTNQAKRNVGYVLQKAGLDAKKMFIRTGAAPAGKDVLSWKEDGVEKWLRIDTEGTTLSGIPTVALAESIQGAHGTIPAYLHWAQTLNNYLRVGITRMPPFFIKQLLKDPISATMVSGSKTNLLMAVSKSFKEYSTAMAGKNESLAMVQRHGLIHNNAMTGDKDDGIALSRQMSAGGAPTAIRSVLNLIDKSAHMADAATRIQIVKEGMNRGLSEIQAVNRALETMNFHKRGAAASIQHANRLLLFFNSTVQANNVALNAFRGRSLHEKDMDVRKKYIHTSAMLFAMGALYSWQMNQDKEYAGFSMKDKIGNLHIPLPGGLPPLKLPLGYFETGGMPWAAGQALAANVMGTAEGKKIGLAMGHYALGAIPGGGGVPFFPGAKQAVEWGLNKDLNTFRDIVPKGMQNKTADQQFRDDTPEIYKSIGATTGASPEQMRHAMNGLFGMAFDNAMQLADHYANVKPGAEKAAIPFEKMPFVSSLMQNPNSSEAKDEMFDMASHATAARDSMNAMKNEGRKGEEIRDYYKAHKVEIALAPMAQKFIADMSQFNKAIKVVDNQEGSAETKAARKKDLQRRQKEVAERFNKARQQVAQRMATAA